MIEADNNGSVGSARPLKHCLRN